MLLSQPEMGDSFYDGCQIPTITQGALANALKLKPEQIEIKTYYAGVLLEEKSLPHRLSCRCSARIRFVGA